MNDPSLVDNEGFYKKYENLIIVLISFALISVLGGYFSHSLTESSAEIRQKEAKVRFDQIKAIESLDKISKAMEARRYWSYKHLSAIEHIKDRDLKKKRYEYIESKYQESIDHWNLNWNMSRVLLRKYFSKERELDFNNPDLDKDENDWREYSISAKFITIHRLLFKLEEGLDIDFKLIEDIHIILEEDINEFYSSLVADIQTGNIAK